MKRIYRCRWDKKVAGVFGGLGQYYKVDPTVLRMLFIFFTSITLVILGISLYLIAWLILPLGPTVYVKIPCKKLYRSIVDRKFGGVCGGIAEYFNIDSSLIRIIFLILTVFSLFFPMLIFYICGMILIPERYYSHNET